MFDLGNGFKNVCIFASVLVCPYLRIILSWNYEKKGRSLSSTSLRSWLFWGKGATEGRPSERWSCGGGNNAGLSFKIDVDLIQDRLVANCQLVALALHLNSTTRSPSFSSGIIELNGKSPPAITTNQRRSVSGCSTTTSKPSFSSGRVEQTGKSPPATTGDTLSPVVQLLRAVPHFPQGRGILERVGKITTREKSDTRREAFRFSRAWQFFTRAFVFCALKYPWGKYYLQSTFAWMHCLNNHCNMRHITLRLETQL